jgi:hypothetical protein
MKGIDEFDEEDALTTLSTVNSHNTQVNCSTRINFGKGPKVNVLVLALQPNNQRNIHFTKLSSLQICALSSILFPCLHACPLFNVSIIQMDNIIAGSMDFVNLTS